MIENRRELFSKTFERIIFCQHEDLIQKHSATFDILRRSVSNLEIVSGLPNISELRLDFSTSQSPSLIIIDDLQTEFLNSPDMLRLLCIQVHHFNISVIVTLQNFFAPSKFGRTLARNYNYKTFFYNRLDLTELRHISIQIQPNNSTFLQSCFKFLSTTYPTLHHYIIVDGHFNSACPQLFVRSRIFPDEKTKKVEPIIFFSSV